MSGTDRAFGSAHGVFALLVAITAVIWVVFELRQSLQHRAEATPDDRGSRVVIRVCTFIGAVGAVVTARNLPAAKIEPLGLAEWLGLVFLIGGVSLRLWSFRTLGRYFTFTVQTSSDQPVITDGPYRVVRHPGYAGILVAVVGLGFFIGNWVSLIILSAAVTAGLVYRIRVEEEALLRDLGPAYAEYAAARKRLVPFVW